MESDLTSLPIKYFRQFTDNIIDFYFRRCYHADRKNRLPVAPAPQVIQHLRVLLRLTLRVVFYTKI